MRSRIVWVLVGVLICLSAILFVAFLHKDSESAEPIANSFRLPLDGSWAVSLEFGRWPSKWCGYHLAEDIGRISETPVYAAADGVVKFAGLAQLGYGYVVVIEHKLPSGDPAGGYVCTVYGHLREENLTSIGRVSKGELIGCLSENPEYNNGFIHLHFGIRKGRFLEAGHDPRRGGWYYGGSTIIFGECNKENPVHQQILAEWVNPTTDQVNGEGFINIHS